MGFDNSDGSAHVFFKQFLGGEQVKIKILLEDHYVLPGTALQKGSFRPHHAAHFAERKGDLAGRQEKRPFVLNQGKVFVVYGDSNLFLVCQGAHLFRCSSHAGAGRPEKHQQDNTCKISDSHIFPPVFIV